MRLVYRYGAPILIFLVGCVLYVNILGNQFVGDDQSQIVLNEAVHSLDNIPSFFTGSTFYNVNTKRLDGAYYKPVLSTYFSVIYAAAGEDPAPYHAVQILLHCINGVLIYYLLVRLLKNRLIPVFLALLYVVHPIQAEAVEYISAAQEVLFMFFGLSALTIMMRSHKKWGSYIAIGALLAASMLSKETGALYVPILIIYAYIYSRKDLIPTVITSIAVSAAYLTARATTVGIFSHRLHISPVLNASLPTRILNMPLVVYTYIRTLTIPTDLATTQSWLIKSISVKYVVAPLIVCALAATLVVWLGIHVRRHRPSSLRAYVFFAIILALGLILHSQIVPLDLTYADRWFYLPMLGVIGLLGVAIEPMMNSSRSIRVVAIIMSVVIAILSIRTYVRNTDWSDEYRLATHDVQTNSMSYQLELSIGSHDAQNGDYESAIRHLKKSTDIYPYVTNYTELATAYSKVGDTGRAADMYRRALTYADYHIAYENLAIVYYQSHDYQRAHDISIRGIKHFPVSEKLWLIKSISLYKLNRPDEALQSSEQCAQLTANANCQKLYQALTNHLPISGI